MYKKACKIVVLLIKPFAFVAFPLPSSDLKVPAIALVDGQNYSKTQRVDADFFLRFKKNGYVWTGPHVFGGQKKKNRLIAG